MARVRSLAGREAGILAGILQGVFRLALGRPLNPTKAQAHAPGAMLASFLFNMIFGSGHRPEPWTSMPAVGGKAGLSREQVEAALGLQDSSHLSERERIASEYADRVSATPVDIPDAFFAHLQQEAPRSGRTRGRILR